MQYGRTDYKDLPFGLYRTVFIDADISFSGDANRMVFDINVRALLLSAFHFPAGICSLK